MEQDRLMAVESFPISVGRRPADVVLVSMPFNVCVMPPIGICSLKAVLDAEGLRARVRHFNLEFLPFFACDLDVAQLLHDEISYLWDFRPGEWLFSPPACPENDAAFLGKLRDDAGVRTEIVAVLAALRPRAQESFSISSFFQARLPAGASG